MYIRACFQAVRVCVRASYLQLVIELKHCLRFVAKLSETGAERGHLLATFVRDVDLIRVYFSQQQIHVHKGLVELFFQDL